MFLCITESTKSFLRKLCLKTLTLKKVLMIFLVTLKLILPFLETIMILQPPVFHEASLLDDLPHKGHVELSKS